MAIHTLEQITSIIVNNPNKHRIQKGRQLHDKLMLHLAGKGLKEALKRSDYYENKDVYNSRAESAISNKDLFGRILQEEDIIFTARGGSSRFGLSPDKQRSMEDILSNVRYGLNLRNWIKAFALPAYRTDPMGVIFMEVEDTYEVDGNAQDKPMQIATPKCYPTYKSINDIFDYDSNGRQLEYVCFNLTQEDIKTFGITDKDYNTDTQPHNNTSNTDKKKTNYYRFVDDAIDVIVKLDNNTLIILAPPIISQKNPIINTWGKVPAFIISDIICFDDPKCFDSPLRLLTELADSFLYDRSIRDLVKKYHGFPKAVEPLLKCSTCMGEGVIRGKACPDCTMPGHDRGSGNNLRTKVSDVIKFPLEMFESGAAPSFDFHKSLGYATPDIEGWNKIDSSLDDYEHAMYYTYWGVSNTKMQGANGKNQKNNDETATKTLANLQPKYTRLNTTADWAERCENMIADFIGQWWFDSSYKGASISYGRNYILELPEDLAQQYYTMCSQNAPDNLKDQALERYLRALYQNNPMQMAKNLKLMRVIPFTHVTPTQVELSNNIPVIDKLAKRFGGEWLQTVEDIYIIDTPVEVLRKQLYDFAAQKQALLPAPETKEAIEDRIID